VSDDLIKTHEQIETMRDGGKRTARVLSGLVKATRPGMATSDYENLAKQLMEQENLTSAVLGYQGDGDFAPFPASLCISVNEEVVHGIPTEYVLKEGDTVGIDVTVFYHGLVLDTAATVAVGAVENRVKKLLDDTEKSLYLGIKAVKDGVTTGDVGNKIDSFLEPKGYGVVRELVGHGVGESMHEPPNVPNYGEPGSGARLRAGMTITIEPMVTLGDWHISIQKGEWPVRTADGSHAAHFEHTVLVTQNGAEILTKE
jgi:methionyl aminopeptidase